MAALVVALGAAPFGCGDDRGGLTVTAGVTSPTFWPPDPPQPPQTTGPATEGATDTAADMTTAGTSSGTTVPTTTSPATTGEPTSGGPTTAEATTGEPMTGAAQFCQEACVGDGDCKINGVDIGYICQDSRCVSAVSECSSDSQCVAKFSGWTTDCAKQYDCPGQVCVDIGGGVGRCATAPSDFLKCEVLMQEEVMVAAIEGDMTVTVCAYTGVKCEDGACFNPCKADADCKGNQGHPRCNVNTGRCECAGDGDCTSSGVFGLAACHGGVCGCVQDSDCSGTVDADTCYGGACGCSSVAACWTGLKFDNTTKVCEGA